MKIDNKITGKGLEDCGCVILALHSFIKDKYDNDSQLHVCDDMCVCEFTLNGALIRITYEKAMVNLTYSRYVVEYDKFLEDIKEFYYTLENN